jgi:hypothetical protein
MHFLKVNKMNDRIEHPAITRVKNQMNFWVERQEISDRLQPKTGTIKPRLARKERRLTQGSLATQQNTESPV